MATKLTAQREIYAMQLAAGKQQTEAFRVAYPTSVKWPQQRVRSAASTLAKDRKVIARVDELRAPALARLDVTIERVLQERARLAFFDIRKLLDANGNPLPIEALDDDTAAAIAGVEFETETSSSSSASGETATRVTTRTAKLKLADKNASLTALEKHLGMYADDAGKGFVLNIQINRWQPGQ